MGVFIGGYDPIKMLEALINLLISKGLITSEEAQNVAKAGKAPA